MTAPALFTPTEAAARLGVNERALRYYAHALDDPTVTDAVFGAAAGGRLKLKGVK